jgi:tetratricopeptide (TPR) repeat protein
VLQVKAVFLWAIRIAATVFCGFAVWWSVRIAVADWAASQGTMEGFQRAMRLAPEDPGLRARIALYETENEDSAGAAGGTAADRDLAAAARMNPYNSNVLMTIGLREEFRGRGAEAEDHLKHAVEVDRQFKPAWTLANFYFRSGQPEKGAPLLRQILNLEPLGFDPDPVFALGWADAGTGDDVRVSRKVLDLLPAKGVRRIQYLDFLRRTKRTDSALEAWPGALANLDQSDAGEVAILTQFVNFLMSQGRSAEAVTTWNALLDNGVVQSERLDATRGPWLADPEFQFPLDAKGFHWRPEEIPGVFASKIASGLRLEITGDEPGSFLLLAATAPVLEGRSYRLRWKSDGSQLNSAHDPGFAFQVAAGFAGGPGAGRIVTQCGALLGSGLGSGLESGNNACEFQAPDGADAVDIRLRYERAQGTVRVSGVLQLDSVRLELAK